MQEQAIPVAVPSLDEKKVDDEHSPDELSTTGLRSSFTPEQNEAFDKFQSLCRNDGLLDDSFGLEDRDCRDGINDEATLFRFFNARGGNATKAYALFKQARDITKKNMMGDFYKSVDLELYQETRCLYGHWVGKRDSRGFPVYWLDLSLLTPASLAAHKKSSEAMAAALPRNPAFEPPNIRRSYAVEDHATRFVLPLCSAVQDRPNPGVPITKSVMIGDITGLTITNAWKMREWVVMIGQLLSINYPEILDAGLVIGAPSYFAVIWSWAKLLLDPATIAKIRFLAPEEVLPVLQEYMDIDDIPQKYGGKFPYEPGMLPILDPQLCNVLKLGEKDLPAGPLHWVNSPNGSKTAVAVGTVKGEKRCTEFATIK